MLGKEPKEVLYFKTQEVDGVSSFIGLCVHNNNLQLSNIVLNIPEQLSIDEYNLILDRFYEEVIQPYMDREYGVTISSGTKKISEYVGSEVAEKLEKWVELIVKSNSNDFDSWAIFIIAVHKKRVTLSANLFERYLIEDSAIDHRLIEETKLRYEYDLDLLKMYDKLNI
jgi:hypothetical protein